MIQFVLIATAIGSAWAGNVPASRKSHPYREHWKHATYGKQAVGGVVGGAALGQMRGHPKNYGGGVGGFGKRLGAGFGSHAAGTTVGHVVASRVHEDLHYHRSNKHGFAPRLGYALKSTVVATNTHTGKHQVAAGRLSGHAASGAVSQGLFHAGSGAATAGVGIGVEAGANVAREFWPNKKHQAKR